MPHQIIHLASSVPLYIQIAEQLIAKIAAGEYKPGDKLPTERALAKVFNVQRATVRQALNVLENRGIIIRRRGSGTFVAKAKIEREARHLYSFSNFATQGYKTGAEILSMVVVDTDAHTSAKMQIPIGTPIYYCHRLRRLDDEPVMLEKIRLPKHIFPGMEQQDLVNNSLFAVIEKEYGHKISRAKLALEAVQASDYEAVVLDVSPGAPLLMEEHISRDPFGTIIEYSNDLYRGDRFRLIVEDAQLAIEIK